MFKTILYTLSILIALFHFGFAQENLTYSQIIEKARKLTQDGNYAKAIQFLDKAKQANPKDHLPYQLTGIALYNQGKYDNAKIQFEKAAKMLGSDYVSETYLGNISARKGDLKKAETQINRAVEMSPEYPYAQIGLGYIALKQKDAAKARMIMKKAISFNYRDDSDIYKQIASIYLSEKMSKDAIYIYNLYIENCGDIVPKQAAEINYLLGKVYDSEKNPRAERAYKTAVELDDKNIKYAENLADYLFRKNNLEEAVKVYLEASKKGTLKPESYYNMGIIYFNAGNLKNAVKYLEKAVSLKTDFVNARAVLSALYLRSGEYAKCIEQNNKIIALDPKNEIALYNNACAYAQKGDKEKALNALKKAIEVNGENKKLAKDEKMFEKLYKDSEFIKITE